ncbi:Uncharacterized protein FWK35_00037378, partial [Aphis craccivora]
MPSFSHRVNSVKDLGIYFESDLSFKLNHSKIITKSLKMLGFINRNTKEFKNPICLKTLYISLVRSNLEFGSIIWSSNYSKYINELDNVQFKFLKRISYITNIHITRDTVNTIENYLSLDSLNIRRQIADIMLVYDILNNLIDCPDLLSEIGFRVP